MTGRTLLITTIIAAGLYLSSFRLVAQDNQGRMQLREQTETSDCHITLGGGGGYFAPLGKVGRGLDAGWGCRIFGLFSWSDTKNIWCDLTYSSCTSREGDGSMTYMSFIPSYAVTFMPFEKIHLFIRPGAGITRVAFDGRNSCSSVDFTLSANGGILGDLPGGLIIGADGGTSCYFERRSSFSACISIFAGYTL